MDKQFLIFCVSVIAMLAPEDPKAVKKSEEVKIPPFEGTVEIKQVDEETETNRYYFKDLAVRREDADPNEEGTATVIDLKRKRFYLLVPSTQVALDLTGDVADALLEDKKRKPAKVEIQKTENTETIAKVECKQWLILKDKKVVTEVWLGESISDHILHFYAINRPGFEDEKATKFYFDSWMKEAAKTGLFPFRMIEKNTKGKELRRFEVTAVEAKEVPYAKFEIPPNFRVLKAEGKKKK